jgi:hypothetical protein
MLSLGVLDSDRLTFGARPEWCGCAPAAPNKFQHFMKNIHIFFPLRFIRKGAGGEMDIFLVDGGGEEGWVGLSVLLSL